MAPSNWRCVRRDTGQAGHHGGGGFGCHLPQRAHGRGPWPGRSALPSLANCFSSRAFSASACCGAAFLASFTRGIDRGLGFRPRFGGRLIGLRHAGIGLSLAARASSRSREIFAARSSSTDATSGSALRDSRIYSTTKMMVPQTTWLMVSGVEKSSCGMPSARAPAGIAAGPTPATVRTRKSGGTAS